MGPVTSWASVTPKVDEVRALLEMYACTLTVNGTLFLVTHTSGSFEQVETLDEVIGAASRLARQG